MSAVYGALIGALFVSAWHGDVYTMTMLTIVTITGALCDYLSYRKGWK